jgi:hypothetical protein
MRLLFVLAVITLATSSVESSNRSEKRTHNDHVRKFDRSDGDTTTDASTITSMESLIETMTHADANITKREIHKEDKKEKKHEKEHDHLHWSKDAEHEKELMPTKPDHITKHSSKSGKSTSAPTYPSTATYAPTPAMTNSKSGKSFMYPSGSKSEKNGAYIGGGNDRDKCGSKKWERCCNSSGSNRRLLHCKSCHC